MLRLILQLVGLVHNDLCGETEWEMFYDSGCRSGNETAPSGPEALLILDVWLTWHT